MTSEQFKRAFNLLPDMNFGEFTLSSLDIKKINLNPPHIFNYIIVIKFKGNGNSSTLLKTLSDYTSDVRLIDEKYKCVFGNPIIISQSNNSINIKSIGTSNIL